MARGLKSCFSVLLVACLLANAFCAPKGSRPKKYRPRNDEEDTLSNDIEVLLVEEQIPERVPEQIPEQIPEKEPEQELEQEASESDPIPDKYPVDDDDDEDETLDVSPSTGSGSNLFSLLNIATALFPGSSSGASATNNAIRTMVRNYLLKYQQPVVFRRQDVSKNVIDVDYYPGLKPPFQRQEDDESHGEDDDDEHDDSHSDDNDDDDGDNEDSRESEENNAAEESVESDTKASNDKASQQESNGDAGGESLPDDDNDSDYDEPEGDGQGGGILGLLAGLSGGEEGSDLGTLLATVSQIVGQLSGEGFDLNAVLASAFGLFVGILSEGNENPGSVIASYLLTSLDTITGGGATNNGAFIGNFLSKLLKGTSAADLGSDESSEEDENGGTRMADSGAFFISLLMSLSGDMSKTSSSGSSSPWR